MQDLLKNKCIFFGTIPKLDELVGTTLIIDENENRDKSIKSDFHWQILKCRILIFSKINVIASPVLNSLTLIYMVVHKNYYNTNYFEHMLVSNNLKILKECHVTPYIFETCLNYTILAKLAPNWNNVDNLLVEGRNFLINQGPLNGVKYNVTVNGLEIVITVCAVKVRLTNVSTENFLDNKNMEEADNHDLYHEKYWINVLPSLKRGRVVSVSKTFPKQSCFKDYTELRRHWKNTYGYRLPENNREMIYLGIHFFGPIVFTYPIQCVRESISILPIHHNYYETISKFVSDLRGVFPNICDVPFHIKDECGYPVPKLLKVNSLLDANHSNWIQGSTSGNLYQDASEFLENNQKLQIDELFSTYESQTFSTQNVSLCTPSQQLQISTNNEIKEKSSQKIPVIPTFIRRSTNCHNFTKIKTPASNLQNSLENSNIPVSERFMQTLMKPIKPTFIKPRKVNMFEILKKNQINVNTQYNKQGIAAISSYNETNLFTNDNKENLLEEAPKEDSNIFSNAGNFKTKITPIFQNKVHNSVNYLVPNFKKCTPKVDEENLLVKSKEDLNIDSNGGNLRKMVTPIFQNKIQNYENLSNPSLKKYTKRKEENLSDVFNKVKKPRNKQLNTDDIRQMALNGTLAKANMPSLTEYLRMNNITYKTKDKKGDLISKVLNHLNLSIN